jgi:hypothetical protein
LITIKQLPPKESARDEVTKMTPTPLEIAKQAEDRLRAVLVEGSLLTMQLIGNREIFKKNNGDVVVQMAVCFPPCAEIAKVAITFSANPEEPKIIMHNLRDYIRRKTAE